MIVDGSEFYYWGREVEKLPSGVVATDMASFADVLLACHAIFPNKMRN